jgi:peptide/nickel transport system permease protein
MTTIAWQRRGRAARKTWTQYRRDREGVAGLVVLAVFVVVAIFAGVFADHDQLNPVNTTENPVWAPPTEHAPLGTDSLGRPIWDQLVYGSQVSLLVGVAATLIAVVIGTVVGVVGGFFGGCPSGSSSSPSSRSRSSSRRSSARRYATSSSSSG